MAAKRELSGAWHSDALLDAAWAELRRPDCTTTNLRLFHNTPEQAAACCLALAANSSVSRLELGTVGEGAAAVALAQLLQVRRLSAV
jgi:hypothetical protein